MSIIEYKQRPSYISIYLLGISVFHLHFCSFLYRLFIKRLLKIRMKQKIKNIRKHKKIRVGFLVSEQSKWGYASVYDAFAKSDRYEPVVLITKLMLEHNGFIKSYYKTFDDCYNYFKNLGYNVELAYNEDKHEYIPLNKLDVDVVFYQQPWELDISQHPLNVSKYAITGYVSYGFELAEDAICYMEDFHRLLDFYFTPSKETKQYMQSLHNGINNLYIAGYPKMDKYFDAKRKKTEKPVIIYAPHHSFEKNGLNMATFQHNGLDILHLAQNTSKQLDWIFKPHPRFKHAVISNNIMSLAEIEDYYNAWEKIGQIYEGGDYINMFVNSTAMITDCCSFLAEYLPSGKPLFHLTTPKEKFNSVAKSFIGSYYSASNFNELLNLFNQVVVHGDDYKEKERTNKINIVFDTKQRAGQNIFNILDKKI